MGAEAEGTEGTQGTPSTEDKPKLLTQEEVNRIVAREARDAAKKAAADLAEALGMPLDKAKEILKAQEDAETAKLSEADKAKREAEQSKADADRLKAEAAKERHEARVERLLGKAGVEANVIAKASRLIEIEVGADEADIDKAIESLKTDLPALFAAAPQSTGTKTPSGIGGQSKPPTSQGTLSGLAKGAAEYERRHGKPA